MISFMGKAWFAPGVLAVLFVGVLGGLLLLIQQRTFQADRASLNASIRAAQENIRQRLHATRDHLVTLAEDMGRENLNLGWGRRGRQGGKAEDAGREGITQEIFTRRLGHYMSEHPELVSAMYVSAEGTALWAVPPQWEEKVLSRPLACPKSLEGCREAQRTHAPVYSDVHISLQNEPAFDLSVPIYGRGTFQGSIVGVYSCEKMLQYMLHKDILRQYKASLVNADGTVIATLPATAPIDERLSATGALDPPGQGVSLRLDRYGSGFWGTGITLLVLLCVGLALGVSIGVWSLKRQMARRAEAERLLREAHDGLSQRVRERTADLETANLRLQQESAERQRAEEQARQRLDELTHVSRVSTLGEMAGGLAHELNQPLGSITSFADGALRLIENRSDCPEALHEALSEISEQARRAGRIIQRLRSFVGTGELQRTPHDLRRLAEELGDLVAMELRQEQVQFRLDVPDSLPPVLVDGIQAQQVLLNLIRNAIEAMEQVPMDRRQIEVKARPFQEGMIIVSVTDTGPGCPAEAIPKMFEAFFTTKQTGLGMGLSISRSIVESHGGRIWATPSPSGGLSVCFTVPTAQRDDHVPGNRV